MSEPRGKKTHDDMWDSGTQGLITRIAVVAALAGLLFGFDTGVISGALDYIGDAFNLGDIGKSAVVSSVLLGAVVGSLVAMAIIDRIGRRRSLIASGAVFIVGSIASAVAPGVGALDIARLLLGVAIGISAVAAPMYITEIAPAARRGQLVSFFQLMITIGILVAYVNDEAFSSNGQWRWMLITGVAPAIVLLIGMRGLPESPRWFMLKGRDADARKVLEKVNPTEVESEMAEMRRGIDEEKTASFRELVQPVLRPALIVAVGLFIIQQFTGINTVIYYAPRIFKDAGFGAGSAAIWATVSVGVINVLATLGALALIDRVGRKPLLYTGLAGMAVSLSAIAVSSMLSSGGTITAADLVTVVAVWAFVAFFAISLGPIPWLMASELFPVGVRGKAASIATVVGWLGNLFISFTFLGLLDLIGESATFFSYAAVAVLGLVFVWFLVPETKGRTLEEIEEGFIARAKARLKD